MDFLRADPWGDVERRLLDHMERMLSRLAPPALDVERCVAESDGNGLHIHLAHIDGETSIDIYSSAEIVVSYGVEHEHFRADDSDGILSAPFEHDDHVLTAVGFVEYLLTGRVELHVWRRPLALRTRTYWLDEAGERHLMLRGGTLGPFWGWSTEPDVQRPDFGHR